MSALRRHIKTVHNNSYPHHCQKCGHGVEKASYLRRHVCNRVRRVQMKHQQTTHSHTQEQEESTQEPEELTHVGHDAVVKVNTTTDGGMLQHVQSFEAICNTLNMKDNMDNVELVFASSLEGAEEIVIDDSEQNSLMLLAVHGDTQQNSVK